MDGRFSRWRVGLLLAGVVAARFVVARTLVTHGATQQDRQRSLALGVVVLAQGDASAAIAQLERAVALAPQQPTFRHDLGNALQAAGYAPQAVSAYRAALALQPEDVRSRNNLAALLELLGQRSTALQEYRQALVAAPQYAVARWNEAACLQKSGQFEAAVQSLDRAVAAVQDKDRPRTQALLEEAHRLAALAADQPFLSADKPAPATAVQAAEAGRVCYYQRRYGAAVQFWARAFAGDASLVERHRYDAACAAVLAAKGASTQSAEDDATLRRQWRQQAFDWLGSECSAREGKLPGSGPLERLAIIRTLRHWRLDPDLSSVRDPAELARLSTEEQEHWRDLWARIDGLASSTPAVPKHP